MAVFCALASVQATRLRRAELERSTQSVLEEEQTADRIGAAVDQQVLEAMYFLQDPRPERLDRFRAESDAVYAQLTRYLFRPLSLRERLQVERIKEVHQRLEVAAQAAFQLAQQGERAAAQERTAALQARVQEVKGALDSFRAMRLEDRRQSLERQRATLQYVYGAIGAIAALWIASLFLLLRLLLRSVLPPLEALGEGARAIARGDYEVRVPVASTDELRVVGHAFNEMAAALGGAREELHLRNTELADALTTLRGAQQDLVQHEKLSALGGMLAGLAHELNNPLASVLGFAELLSERLHQMPGEEAGQLARELADPIAHEALRARELMRNLLQFSRKSDMVLEPVDVNEAMAVAVALRSYAFAQAGLQLQVRLEPDLWARADMQRLEQAFLNILNNAYDALQPRGRGLLDIYGRRNAEGQVLVVFADDGPGLEQPERVFDPFYTTKPVGGGTGLGLTLVHQMAQDAGGSVTAENSRTGGARFVLRLPAIDPPALPTLPVPEPAGNVAASTPAEPPQAAPRPAAVSRRPRLLVLDDEESIRNLHSRILGRLDVDVVLGASAMEGIELIRRRGADLVITDIKMPGELDGIGLHAWLEREQPELAARLLFVTGDVHDPALADLLETNPHRFIMKPFQIKEYLETVRSFLPAAGVAKCA